MRFKVFSFIAAFVLLINSNVSAQHIYVEGTKLMVNGCPIYMNGANTPWQNWNDFGGSYNSTFWSSHFQDMSSYGLNSSRIWISCNGDGQPYVSNDGTVSPPSQAFWEDMDDMLSHAQKNGIYIMATIMSFDHFKNGNSNYQGWRAMITSKEKTQSFIDNYLLPLVERYKDNPYLFNIDLCNEPEWVHERDDCGKISWEHFQRFAGMCTAAIHNSGSKVLVSIGSASVKWNSNKPGHEGNIWSDANIQTQSGLGSAAFFDFWHFHYYSWINQYYSNPFEKDPVYYEINDRPCIIGETPARINNGEDLYGIAGMTEEKIFDNPYQLGYSGVYPWTSNDAGDGDFGSLATFGSAAKAFYNNHADLIDGTCDNSNNAFLKLLQLSEGEFSPEFSMSVFNYSIDIPDGTSVPQVFAESADMNASVTINQASSLPGKATVKVISKDKSKENTYTIQFNTYIPTPSTLEITPNEIQVQLNKSQEFTARVFDQIGMEMPDESVLWSINGGGALSDNSGNSTVFTSENVLGDFLLTVKSSDLQVVVPISISLGSFIPIPDSVDWIVTTKWEDQHNTDEFGSSYVSNENSALLISHRTWGYGELYAINSGTAIELEAGVDYAISFDFQDDAVVPIEEIEVGFADTWAKEVTNETSSTFMVSSGLTSNDYSKISGTVTAASSGKSYLYILFSWGADPTNDKPSARYNSYLKNLSIVPKVDLIDSDGDGTPDISDLCPNNKYKIDPGKCGCEYEIDDCFVNQTITFEEGWNFVSVYVIPEDNSIETLFEGKDVDVIKNNDHFFASSQPYFLNTLSELITGEGYLIHVNSNFSVEVQGKLLENPAFSAVSFGWDIIGVPFDSAVDVSKITSKEGFSIIKGFDLFKKADGTGTLEKIEPGKAYFVLFE